MRIIHDESDTLILKAEGWFARWKHDLRVRPSGGPNMASLLAAKVCLEDARSAWVRAKGSALLRREWHTLSRHIERHLAWRARILVDPNCAAMARDGAASHIVAAVCHPLTGRRAEEERFTEMWLPWYVQENSSQGERLKRREPVTIEELWAALRGIGIVRDERTLNNRLSKLGIALKRGRPNTKRATPSAQKNSRLQASPGDALQKIWKPRAK